jgi:CHAT domain-containing protein/Tfp pilus assembly protein PilF
MRDSFAQSRQEIASLYESAEKLFQQAEPTATTDSLALQRYLGFVRGWEEGTSSPRLLMDAWLKAGILRQTYGDQEQALAHYQQAISVGQQYALEEPLYFQPYLYAGNALYFLQRMDASVFYLKQAEQILSRFPGQEEAGRLYNSFGAIYFELGNYQQSINYFSKAMDEIRSVAGKSSEAILAFKSNIASALRHLQKYDSAIQIYQSLLPLDYNKDELYINLGTTYLEQQQPDSALFYLSRVNEQATARKVVLYNKLAQAHFLLGNIERARQTLEVALSIEKPVSEASSNDRLGFTYKLYGDILQKEGDYLSALHYYQQAIVQYDANFEEMDIFSNPQTFAGDFTSFTLFDALISKAKCFSFYHQREQDIRYLLAAVDTYESAIRMADYISKVFDNEDARIFLSERAFPAFQQSVNLLIEAYALTGDASLLEKAMGWSEKSKANTLAVSLKESQIKSFSGLPDSLLREERRLKQQLSRLFVRLDNARDEEEVIRLEKQVRDQELALSRLQDRFHEFPEYFRQKFSYDSLNIRFLQSSVLDSKSALLSYFHAGDKLHLFVLTDQTINYRGIELDSQYHQMLDVLESELRTLEPGRAYQGGEAARHLYDLLIGPAEALLKRKESLIIVPHQRLNNIAFEALVDHSGRYLLQQYNLIYQFAATFLQAREVQTTVPEKSLAVAPFTGSVALSGFLPLPSSAHEVESLSGTRLKGQEASKDRFLELTAQADVIHLATHAMAASEEPSRSYVTFYPDSENDSTYKLFAHELYNISLSQTKLAFLSACETSGGKLINSEGIMSLSRAFAYAGCPNLVTSIWEAEDHATAYISRRFYYHLEDGHSFSHSLRQAKLDFLKDPAYAQFHTPAFWANLVFIGMPGEEPAAIPAAVWGIMGLLLLLTALFFLRKFLKKGRGSRVS